MSYQINDQFNVDPSDETYRDANKEGKLIETKSYEGIIEEVSKKKEKGWFNKIMHIEGTYGEIPRPISEIIEENRAAIEEVQKLIPDSQGGK